ncbi:MAG: Bicarbonate transport system permease protein CmpB [Paracidovorax wautersii]|uniref:Bicarbonate transport system permease protein CmpB n=1 Tax=Paracidovorax wautersii TaxID=1177982 RepID=A0A7V8JR34_9BURK|nr:MAG: Bicarbonate transport system permease protein CmpB [Paracidovorax wautersii]
MAAATGPVAAAPARALGRRLLPWAGLLAALALWELGVAALASRTPIAHTFSPGASAAALQSLLAGGELWPHIAASLRRVLIGLLLALLIGVPAGLALGLSPTFRLAVTPLLQLLRMISPLSWMPLAVMALGIGDAPVIFLLVFAAVWPVLLNTAAGVAALDPHWLRLARSLSATRGETLRQVILPGVVAHVLTGFRLAVGILWIVLVPAEMLGVSSGLGYFILDTRDRLAYDELTATIVVIGLLGYALDALARLAWRRWTRGAAPQD